MKIAFANCQSLTINTLRKKKSCIVYCLLFVVCCLLSSCFKEKPLAPPSKQGIGQTAMIEMGPNYNDQFFFNLETNRVVSNNSRFAYDLMFDCGDDDYNVWLNTAKFMAVVRTGKTDIAQVTLADTAGKPWLYELGEFNKDSNAVGDWWIVPANEPETKGEVFIVNLGVDNDETPLGYVKMRINDFNGSSYSVSFCSLKDTAVNTAIIQKDNTRNYRYFSFSGNGSIVNNIEPDKTEWDLCFTRYSVVFYDPYYLPYQVTGVLHNPSKVSAYIDSTVVFNDVQIGDFDISRLQTRRDAIGYEWKRYELGDYTIKTWFTYFVKTDEDKYYKLRFLDFKRAGVRGYPTFEYHRL